jgi:hypothetical protein
MTAGPTYLGPPLLPAGVGSEAVAGLGVRPDHPPTGGHG